MKKKVNPEHDSRLIRVVRDSANANKDYWISRDKAKELNLPYVNVYNNEVSAYDPEGKYFHLRFIEGYKL